MDPLAIALFLGFTFAAEEDKAKHAVAGAGAAIIAEQVWDHPLAPCGASLALGAAKEAYDSFGHGHVEAADMFATGFGCVITFRF